VSIWTNSNTSEQTRENSNCCDGFGCIFRLLCLSRSGCGTFHFSIKLLFPLLQAKLDFHSQDSYRLAYLSIINRESFETLKGSGFLKGLFLDPPADLESGWGVFHQAQMKEISKTSLNIDQERERSLSILGLDKQAGQIIHDCLSGGLGLSYTYWSTNKSTTILQLNWKGQGALPLKIVKSHLDNARSTLSTGNTALFDGPVLVRESKTITLKRNDANEDITVTFDVEPQVSYQPPIIPPFPKKTLCTSHTYVKDPKTGADYVFRNVYNLDDEKLQRPKIINPYGTDWFVTFTAPPEGMRLFTNDGKISITAATCDRLTTGWVHINGENGGTTVQANGVGTPTVSCEGGKNGQPGDLVIYGAFTVTDEACNDIDW
jgi:hypothetical protein